VVNYHDTFIILAPDSSTFPGFKLKCFVYKYVFGKYLKLYLNGVHFLTSVLIRLLWHLKTVVFLHRFLICTVIMKQVDLSRQNGVRQSSRLTKSLGTSDSISPRDDHFRAEFANIKDNQIIIYKKI
jgi:hypothetical protein